MPGPVATGGPGGIQPSHRSGSGTADGPAPRPFPLRPATSVSGRPGLLESKRHRDASLGRFDVTRGQFSTALVLTTVGEVNSHACGCGMVGLDGISGGMVGGTP